MVLRALERDGFCPWEGARACTACAQNLVRPRGGRAGGQHGTDGAPRAFYLFQYVRNLPEYCRYTMSYMYVLWTVASAHKCEAPALWFDRLCVWTLGASL